MQEEVSVAFAVTGEYGWGEHNMTHDIYGGWTLQQYYLWLTLSFLLTLMVLSDMLEN